jgi:hypothetical protein
MDEDEDKRFSVRKFLRYTWGTIIRPSATFRQILQEERGITYGFVSIVILCLLYSVGAYYAFVIGSLPYGWEPVLRIPIETYFFWETFFLTPVGIAG